MKRAALVVSLLLPLSAWAAAPTASPAADPAAAIAPHAWPQLATASGPALTMPAFPAFPPNSLVDKAVEELEEIERNPSPVVSVPSLAHVDLAPHARVALICRPQVTTSVLGPSRSGIALLSLQW